MVWGRDRSPSLDSSGKALAFPFFPTAVESSPASRGCRWMANVLSDKDTREMGPEGVGGRKSIPPIDHNRRVRTTPLDPYIPENFSNSGETE